AALVGTDADVHKFLTTTLPIDAEHDDRVRLTKMMATSGPAVRKAANTAYSGSIDDVRAFLDSGWRAPWEVDQRQRVSQVTPRGGPQVQQAATPALSGSIDDVVTFITTGQYTAQDKDDRVRVAKILDAATDGSAVYVACQRALSGDANDIREFLDR